MQGLPILFSPAEREVLYQVVELCKSNKQIALETGRSTKTIESHRKRAYEKAGAKNLAELCKWYWQRKAL